MTMTPQDIQSKQFHVRFRGFDVEEVDEFLEQVAEQYMMLQEENKTLQEEVDTLQAGLDGLKVEESSFKDAIISAQKISEEMKKKSKEEANELLLEAQDEVKNLKDEANREIAALEYRVDELSSLQGKLQTDLKSTIVKYLEQIDETFVPVSAAVSLAAGHDAEDVAQNQVDIHGVNVDNAVSQHETVELEAERDLSDLYEKIDLDSITEPHEEDVLTVPKDDLAEDLSGEFDDIDDIAAGGLSAADITDKLPSLDLDVDGSSSIPDLDDDVMFTLDDPLDIDDIDMPIASGESEKADK